MKSIILTFMCGLVGCCAQAQTRSIAKPVGTERRIALVMGNQAYYPQIGVLKNPTNDANDMAEALKKLDFEVIKVLNATKEQMGQALTNFKNKLTQDDIAFFYYAGHGASFGDKNYFLPIDYNAGCLEQIEDYGIAFNRLLGDIAAQKVKNSFVVLDACRNIPNLRVCDDTKRGTGGNSASVKPTNTTNNPRGSVVVYATEQGTEAEDRNPNGRNGLFTGALLKYLTTPDLTFKNIIDKASVDVENFSEGRQTPARYDKIYGDFYFLKTEGYSPPPPPPALRSGTTKDLPYGPRMVFVGGGSYPMGSNDGGSDEKPVHEVQVGDFWMAQTEVTVGQYLEFCEATNSHWPEWLEKGNSYHVETGSDKHYANKGYTRTASNLPIAGVSWDDAVAYCGWLKSKTGLGYRLPTEAEWEYAARGGTLSNGTVYAGSTDPNAVAWTDANAGGKPHNVATKSANELGLYDMSGNLWEWCSDWYKGYPGSSGVSDYTGSTRVLRGGGWYGYPQFSRVAYRRNLSPSLRNNDIGLRLVSPQ